MKKRLLAIVPIACLVMALGFMGASRAPAHAVSGSRPAPQRHAAFIYNLGIDDFAGFRIAVDPSGKAWAVDGGGQSSGDLQNDLVRRFFNDLNAAGPLNQLPNQKCSLAQPGIQFTTNVKAPLIVTWSGQSSPDLTCAADQRLQNLRADAIAIQRELSVQSYRVRTIVFGESNTTNASIAGKSYLQPASSPLSNYSFNGNGFSSSISSSGSKYGAGFSAGRFSNEPFSMGGFTSSRSSSSGLSLERFNTESFSNNNFSSDFHFSNDFRSQTFNSTFSSSFSNGGFGNGGFSSPNYSNGGFGAGGFGGGNYTGFPVP